MARTGITLKIDGFEKLLKDIEAAGGSINSAAESCLRQSAQIVQTDMKNAMRSKDIDSGIISRMPQPKIEVVGNLYSAEVGYDKGNYNPKNLSDGYKALFLNVGTPHRKKHGKETARGYITLAKETSKKKLKKAQQKALEKILSRLK